MRPESVPVSGAGAGVPECSTVATARSRTGDEKGSASLLVAIWMVVLVLFAAAGIVLASVLAARESVASAADLAALAGASASLEQPAQACAWAGEIAGRNGAVLFECQVSGAQVWVSVAAPAPRPVRWLLARGAPMLRARAHAELTAQDP